jgi:hypothetical protein
LGVRQRREDREVDEERRRGRSGGGFVAVRIGIDSLDRLG